MIPGWVRRWSERRTLPQTGAVTLRGDRIYILPNGHGFLTGVALMTMLLLCLNYNLNLGFLVTFLATSLFLVSIFHTWRTLNGLVVGFDGAEPVFAGETARFLLYLDNQGRLVRRDLWVEGEYAAPKEAPILKGGRRERFTLERVAPHRGWQPLGLCTLFTRAPLGVMVAWSHVELEAGVLVYPAPEKGPVPLPMGTGEENRALRASVGADEYHGLRAYQHGDTPRHLHWKASARAETLLSKQYQSPDGQRLTLAWEETAGLADEARLSRLCRWVLDAEQAQQDYALHLPALRIPHGHGEPHRTRCLTALAQHGSPPP